MIITKENFNTSQPENNYINRHMFLSEQLKSIIVHVFKAIITLGICIVFSSYRSTFYNEVLNGQCKVSLSTAENSYSRQETARFIQSLIVYGIIKSESEKVKWLDPEALNRLLTKNDIRECFAPQSIFAHRIQVLPMNLVHSIFHKLDRCVLKNLSINQIKELNFKELDPYGKQLNDLFYYPENSQEKIQALSPQQLEDLLAINGYAENLDYILTNLSVDQIRRLNFKELNLTARQYLTPRRLGILFFDSKNNQEKIQALSPQQLEDLLALKFDDTSTLDYILKNLSLDQIKGLNFKELNPTALQLGCLFEDSEKAKEKIQALSQQQLEDLLALKLDNILGLDYILKNLLVDQIRGLNFKELNLNARQLWTIINCDESKIQALGQEHIEYMVGLNNDDMNCLFKKLSVDQIKNLKFNELDFDDANQVKYFLHNADNSKEKLDLLKDLPVEQLNYLVFVLNTK